MAESINSLQDITRIVKETLKTFDKDAKTNQNVAALKNKYLGKKSVLKDLFNHLKNIPANEKKDAGMAINNAAKEIEAHIAQLKDGQSSEESAQVDISLPEAPITTGNVHPLTTVERRMNRILEYMGFNIYDGPHVTTDFYNCELLGLPKDHPARSLQDSFYIKYPEILLRTQNSAAESHYIRHFEPPMRVIIPSLSYRYENLNASNHVQFHQYQAFIVDKGITFGHLKFMVEYFFKELMGNDVKVRFRNKYYPEVYLGVGIDLDCTFCKGKGCSFCKYRGFVESGGAGMIIPHTLKMSGIDPEEYTGFAWGLGYDRIAMQIIGMNDIRSLNNSFGLIKYT